MTADAPLFLGPALETVARVLGLCDRDGSSPTYGCCDRHHWHYRTTDFANARMQEAGFLLALAYSAPLVGNRFRGRNVLLEWTRAIWRFWLRRRNNDGSAVEVYPYERSNCATSFTAALFTETVKLLGGNSQWREELAEAKQSFEWLEANSSLDVANQTAASLLALTGYARLTGNSRVGAAADRRCDQFMATVEPDGTFGEYGGFDAGYQSITLSTLIRTQRFCGANTTLGSVIERGEARLRGAIDEFGRTDPAANSRRTQFLYPYGLAALNSPALKGIEAGIRENTILLPTWLDDRYCIGMAIDYLLTAWELSDANDVR
jgi:hypothetical protein